MSPYISFDDGILTTVAITSDNGKRGLLCTAVLILIVSTIAFFNDRVIDGGWIHLNCPKLLLYSVTRTVTTSAHVQL
jgi:hypothetical protein